jgi:HAD superfamily hydrolase (TIGR01509 family)
MLDFKAAIFDLDGTLIDSMNVWEKIDIEFLAKRNFSVPEGYIAKVSSMSFNEAADYTISFFGLKENPKDMIEEWNQMAIYKYSHEIKLKPHTKEYLLYLKKNGIKLGTATALPNNLYVPVLKNNGVYDMFEAHTSVDEVQMGKGYPDIYLLAAKKLGTLPKDCIVFEDVFIGIKSIKEAGMKACGVYDKYSEHERDEIVNTADCYIYDFKEIM